MLFHLQRSFCSLHLDIMVGYYEIYLYKKPDAQITAQHTVQEDRSYYVIYSIMQ